MGFSQGAAVERGCVMDKHAKPVLLVAEDEPIRLSIAKWGDRAGFDVVTASAAPEAVAAVEKASADGRLAAAVCDLHLPGGTGVGGEWGGWEVLTRAYALSRQTRLAVFTAWAGHQVNRVFQSGAAVPAFTIFEKSRDDEKLREWLRSTREAWSERLALSLRDADTREIYEKLAPAWARSELPILILGESGTGKESLASEVHRLSDRKGLHWAVNCGGLEPTVAFGELFGHTRSAFSGAERHELGLVLRASGYQDGTKAAAKKSFREWLKSGNPDLIERDGVLESANAKELAGTIFLDEVATLTPKVMAGLLRVLSTRDMRPLGYRELALRTYCRIVAATNEVDVLAGAAGPAGDERERFRRDLCFRLAGAVLKLPSLAQRDQEDIRHYLRSVVWSQLGLPDIAVEDKALDACVDLFHKRTDDQAREYQSGNFRALQHIAHRAALLARADNADSITEDHFNLALKHGTVQVDASVVRPAQDRGGPTAEELEALRQELTRGKKKSKKLALVDVIYERWLGNDGARAVVTYQECWSAIGDAGFTTAQDTTVAGPLSSTVNQLKVNLEPHKLAIKQLGTGYYMERER